MSRRNDSWGIEVGANEIKAVRLVRHGTDVSVADFDILQFKPVLSSPQITTDTAIRDEAIRANLDQFLTHHDISKCSVMASVPGNAAFAKFAKLPPVEPKKIPDIVRFEAVQQIPFPINEVQWDYQVFTQPDSPDVYVGIFAITQQRVEELLTHYRSVGLSVDGLTLSSLAVYNAMAHDMDITPDAPGTIFVDIGTTNTDVIIVEHGCIWLRTLPIGGHNFTEALVRAFKLSYRRAEKLKREAATNKYSRQIFQALRPVFTDFFQEMQRTLGYYQNMNRDAELTRLIGFGSTFRLPGMQKVLKQLDVQVVRLSGFKKLTVEGKRAGDFADKTLNLATAYGLALQGLGLEKVSANILPVRDIKQRLWRSKQPWIAAAAGLMIAASTAAWAKLKIDQGLYEAAVQQSQPRITQVTQKANGFVNQWRDIEGRKDPRPRIENLRRILDYRQVWPRIMQDLTLATQALANAENEQLTPHNPLWGSDYDAIKKIPPQQRQRVYIDSLTAQYLFTPDPDQGRRGENGYTSEQTWGASASTSSQPDPALAPGHVPPSFLITVKGKTQHKDGSKLISERLIRWLQVHQDPGDRPYRIIATKESLVGYAPDRRGAAAGSVGGLANPTTLDDTSTPTIAVIDNTDMASLLPIHPLKQEAQAAGWVFELQWTVQLLRPEDARHATATTSSSNESDDQTMGLGGATGDISTPTQTANRSPGAL